MMTTATVTLRERLKTETLDLHQAVERRSPLVALFRGQPWADDHGVAYRKSLSLQLDLIDALARHKEDWEQNVPSLSAVLQTRQALVRDLLQDDVEESTAFECSAAESIGLGYVMLGSSMGSQVILDKIGSGIPENQRHFLIAMAEASRAFFKFCEEVKAYETQADDVVRGARKAFEHLMIDR